MMKIKPLYLPVGIFLVVMQIYLFLTFIAVMYFIHEAVHAYLCNDELSKGGYEKNLREDSRKEELALEQRELRRVREGQPRTRSSSATRAEGNRQLQEIKQRMLYVQKQQQQQQQQKNDQSDGLFDRKGIHEFEGR